MICRFNKGKAKATSEKQVDILLLPEMSFTGFSMNTDVTKEADEKIVERVSALAWKNQVAIGFGWAKFCGGEHLSCEEGQKRRLVQKIEIRSLRVSIM